jgi:hypothetical protein
MVKEGSLTRKENKDGDIGKMDRERNGLKISDVMFFFSYFLIVLFDQLFELII